MYKKELTFLVVNVNPFTFSKGIGLLNAMSDTYLQYDNLGIKTFKLSLTCVWHKNLQEC